MTTGMKTPPVVSEREWEAAWQQLLLKEKELTRSRDALAAERRRMPWMAVEKTYEFNGPNGKVSLVDLFDGRRQLVVYRAFYEPGITTYAEGTKRRYPQIGCVGCSFIADQIAHPAHLNARDTTLAFASRAPQIEIEGLKERMGWQQLVARIRDRPGERIAARRGCGTVPAADASPGAVGVRPHVLDRCRAGVRLASAARW